MGTVLVCCPDTTGNVPDPINSQSVSFAVARGDDAVEKLHGDVAGDTDPHRSVARIRRQLPEKPVICILGSTAFNDPKTEERVNSIASVFRERLGHRVTFVTGGMNGVQLTFAKRFQGGDIFQILPAGKQSDFQYGTDLHAGQNHEQRQEVLGLVGHLYLTVEGGPGVAKEAGIAVRNGACVIPLMSSGGASGGLFDFPKECFSKPSWAPEPQWNLLEKKEATPSEVAAALTELMEIYLDRIC